MLTLKIIAIVWVCFGLLFALVAISLADKNGVGKHRPEISYLGNEIINFFVVVTMLSIFIILGPLTILACLRQK